MKKPSRKPKGLSGGKAYLKKAIAILRQVMDSQAAAIGSAADLLARVIADGKSIFSFGASHSFILTEEMVYRAGGLMLVNPIYPHGMNLSVRPLTATSRLERLPGLGTELLNNSPAKEGDALILTSVSGRNAVIIDMALAAQARRIHTVGIVSQAYHRAVASRHPSGKKLADLCEVVIDNGAPYGDAVAAIPGAPQKVGPVSSVTGCAIVNAIVCETVKRLAERGLEPPVFMSANTDQGDAFNARLLKKNKHRIHYL